MPPPVGIGICSIEFQISPYVSRVKSGVVAEIYHPCIIMLNVLARPENVHVILVFCDVTAVQYMKKVWKIQAHWSVHQSNIVEKVIATSPLEYYRKYSK